MILIPKEFIVVDSQQNDLALSLDHCEDENVEKKNKKRIVNFRNVNFHEFLFNWNPIGQHINTSFDYKRKTFADSN